MCNPFETSKKKYFSELDRKLISYNNKSFQKSVKPHFTGKITVNEI